MIEDDVWVRLDARFQTLEHKVVDQEYLLEQLNSVVTRQQEQIDGLSQQVEKFRALVAENAEPTIDGTEEPPPPHY